MIRRMLAAAFLSLGVLGCDMSDSNLPRVGMTRDEVRAVQGEPDVILPMPGQEIWTYRGQSGNSAMMVTFGADDTVVEVKIE